MNEQVVGHVKHLPLMYLYRPHHSLVGTDCGFQNALMLYGGLFKRGSLQHETMVSIALALFA